MNRYDVAERNVAIFWDTIRMINTIPELHTAVRNTIDNTTIYPDDEEIEFKVEPRFTAPAEIVLSQKRSFQAAIDSISAGKTCVLNFASAHKPGGGVIKGSGAQEESLCRCSTLHPSLIFDDAYDKYYARNNDYLPPMGSDGIIYSPEIVILKTDESEPKRLPARKRVRVDVLTCAAPDFRRQDYNEDAFISAMRRRIRRILQVASDQKVDNLILGAFGCGAFRNPPEIVAEIFKEELTPYMHSFKRIEFAIKGFRTDPNYAAFEKVFK